MVTFNLTHNSDGRPAENYEVIIKWVSGGTTSGKTNKSGQVTLRTNGTAEYVRVDKKEVLTNAWLEGTNQQFTV